MTSIFTKILGINYKTVLAGVTVIVAAIGRILIAYRTKDFSAIFTDGQLVLTTIISIIAGLGLINAKDSNTTGVGANAKKVDSDGTVTRADGTVTPPVA